MKPCPKCGSENLDYAKFCVKCGAPLGPKIAPPREKVMDHLRYAVDVSSSNLKIFLPYIGFYVGFIILVIVFVVVFGIGYWFTNPLESSPESSFIGLSVFFLVFMVAFICVGVLSTPFLQHIYYSAAVGNEVKFRESFRYAVSRFLAFLGADIIGVVFFGIIPLLWLMLLPPEALILTTELDFTLLFQHAGWIIILVPFIIIYSYVLNIMAWDNVSFGKALRLSYDFIRNRFVQLFSLSLILILAEAVLMYVPLGNLVAFIPATIIDIATIDIYIHYQKSKGPDIKPITV